jgi:hypothetical protein
MKTRALIPHIIVMGNPVDGLQFIGPFLSAAAAAEHGNTDPHIEADWWVAPVEAP